MGKVVLTTYYQESKEVPIGRISSGHTVMLKSPNGNIGTYMVCKTGNTSISCNDKHKTVLLCNQVTGRLVLKHPLQKCVIASSTIQVNSYSGEYKNAETTQ